MNDIPDFVDAIEQFRGFLADNGYPADVFWVFREDVWKISSTEVRLKYPSSVENVGLAQKVFTEGRERGLVDVHAIATTGTKVAATIWFPKYPNEEVQGWHCGMKLSISQPLPDAKAIGVVRWWLLRFLPRFRQYQKAEWVIGTKAWAAA